MTDNAIGTPSSFLQQLQLTRLFTQDAGRVPTEAPPPSTPETAYEAGQALAEEIQNPDVMNDPDAVAAVFEENAEQLADPDFAAGFIAGHEPEYLHSIVGNFPHASRAQQVELVELYSDALGAASHSRELPDQWVDGFFTGHGGMADSKLDRYAVGQLMRTGDFSTQFLTRAVRDVVLVGYDPTSHQNPVTWALDGSNNPDDGLGWILRAVERNPQASAVTTATYAEELLENAPASDSWHVAAIFETGTVDYREVDPGMAELAARELIGAVDDRQGQLLFGYDDAMAAIAAEYFDDIAYAANSPVDIPLDQQDWLRDGIEMPFQAAHHLLYAAGGASDDAVAELILAAAEWEDQLGQTYEGDPNLSSAYGRQAGAAEALLSGSLASRMIDDGRATDERLQQSREGLSTLINAVETKGASLKTSVVSAAKDMVVDWLIPRSNAEAEARSAYVEQTWDNRRDAFRSSADYLLRNPSNLEAYNLGQNPQVTVDITPAATIEQYERALASKYAESGDYGFTVDADFTVSNGQGGLQIMPIEDMTAAQRGAYVQWVNTPEVQQVLLEQVNARNQAHDDIPFGMGNN